MIQGIVVGIIIYSALIVVCLYFLLKVVILARRHTATARIVSFSTNQTDDTRNFGVMPNLSRTDVSKQNMGFPPDVSCYIVVDVETDRGLKLKKLHCKGEVLNGIGRIGDIIRITYRGRKLISFARDID